MELKENPVMIQAEVMSHSGSRQPQRPKAATRNSTSIVQCQGCPILPIKGGSEAHAPEHATTSKYREPASGAGHRSHMRELCQRRRFQMETGSLVFVALMLLASMAGIAVVTPTASAVCLAPDVCVHPPNYNCHVGINDGAPRVECR